MAHRKPSILLDQRQSGRRLVFSVLRRAERVARIDIARETQISPATVTSITAEFISAGLIEEIASNPDESHGKRGRPRVELQIRGAAHLVAGIKLSDRSAAVAIIDFAGKLVGEYRHPLPSSRLSSREIVTVVRSALNKATSTLGIAVTDLSAIGIGMPGMIDATRGFVYWSPSCTDRNISLRSILSGEIGLPVFVDNDVNLVALAEQWFGLGREVSDFIVVTIEHGVGMGIVIDNKIYRGAHGCGAEFGHIKVQLDGALCRCGQRGCLEAYVADYALLREASITAEPIVSRQTNERLQELFRRAKAGDETARSIFNRAGRMFAMGLANIVNIFDPALIILSGERMQFDYLFADEAIESMKRSVGQINTPPPEVRIHKWDDLMWAKGAAAFALEGVTEMVFDEIADNGI